MYGQSKHVQEQLFNHLFLFLYETKNFPRGFIIVVLSFPFVENKKEKKKKKDSLHEKEEALRTEYAYISTCCDICHRSHVAQYVLPLSVQLCFWDASVVYVSVCKLSIHSSVALFCLFFFFLSETFSMPSLMFCFGCRFSLWHWLK